MSVSFAWVLRFFTQDNQFGGGSVVECLSAEESPQQETLGFLHQLAAAHPEVSPKARFLS
ncbi:MAG: hypothetical protein J5I94_25645 [Phaeodactylibacter sp.]|nr:hypothetical protein [Phaeodactylibacter sp.]